MNADRLVARLNGEIALEDQRLLATTLIAACRGAADDVARRHRLIPLAHVAGQDRYYAIQEAFLALNNETRRFTVTLERHARRDGKRCSTHYAVVNTPGLRLTVRKVLHRHDPPAGSLFEYLEQERQLNFFNDLDPQLVAAITYGYDTHEMREPSFIEILFQDGNNGYVAGASIDLLGLLNEPVPVESQAIVPSPQLRIKERPQTAGR